jgi:hypothetical protein
MKKLMVCMLAMSFPVVWGTLVYSTETPKVDGKTLFEQKCGLCHSLKKPESKRKTAKEWEKTVMQMKENGCPITDEQATAIIQYLSQRYGK